jgi:hypothetical protein
MHPISDKATLVVAGSFNPAILVPMWIAKNVVDPPIVQEFPVNMIAQISGIGVSPKFTFNGLSYSPSFQSLVFYLEGLDPRGCQRVCDVSARILELLPHTPVTAIGFNFGFAEDHPSVQLLQLLQASAPFADALGHGAEIVGRNWVNVATWGDALVTLHGQIRGSTAVTLDLNFHYTVQDAAGGVAVMKRKDVYAEHLAVAEKVTAAINQE